MNNSPISMDIEQLRDNADSAGQLLKALGNPDRLLLLCQLVHGVINVGDVEERLKSEQSILSQQLGLLLREGLVNTRSDGRQIYYSISSKEAMAIIETLYKIYCLDKM